MRKRTLFITSSVAAGSLVSLVTRTVGTCAPVMGRVIDESMGYNSLTAIILQTQEKASNSNFEFIASDSGI